MKDTILDLKELTDLYRGQLGTETVPRFKAGGKDWVGLVWKPLTS